jgi:hypothetical protein
MIIGNRIPLIDLRNDNLQIQQRYYEASVDVLEAAMMEFVATSVHRSWMGKYRCLWCKRSGYVWPEPNSYWWGHTHGKNCAKRP